MAVHVRVPRIQLAIRTDLEHIWYDDENHINVCQTTILILLQKEMPLIRLRDLLTLPYYAFSFSRSTSFEFKICSISFTHHFLKIFHTLLHLYMNRQHNILKLDKLCHKGYIIVVSILKITLSIRSSFGICLFASLYASCIVSSMFLSFNRTNL